MKTTIVPLSEKKHYKFFIKADNGGRVQLGGEYGGFAKLIIEQQREER